MLSAHVDTCDCLFYFCSTCADCTSEVLTGLHDVKRRLYSIHSVNYLNYLICQKNVPVETKFNINTDAKSTAKYKLTNGDIV